MKHRSERNRRALDASHLERGLAARTAQGGIIGVSSQAIAIGLQLVNAAVMARLLQPSDFGLIAMAIVVTGFVALFQDLGLSTATIQKKSIDQDLISGLFLINLGMGLGIMITCWAVAPWAASLYDDPRVEPLVVALSATIPLSALGAQHRALLQRRMMWWRLRTLQLLPQFVGVITGILVAILSDLGYWALVVTQWTNALVGAALAWLLSSWRPSRVENWSGVRSAVGFGVNLTVFQFANWFNRNLDNALIGWRWGPDELGHYTRAYMLLMLPLTLISGPVTAAVLPALSRLQDQQERWRDRLLEAMGAAFFLSSGLISVVIAAAEPLVFAMYGQGWETAVSIFQILLLAMYGQMIANLNGWIYISSGNTRSMALFNMLFRLPVSLVCYSIGVTYGATGVAMGFVVATYVSVVPAAINATRNTGLSFIEPLKTAVGPVLAGIIAAITAYSVLPQFSSSTFHDNFTFAVQRGVVASLVYTGLSVTIVLVFPSYSSLRSRLIMICKGLPQSAETIISARRKR